MVRHFIQLKTVGAVLLTLSIAFSVGCSSSIKSIGEAAQRVEDRSRENQKRGSIIEKMMDRVSNFLDEAREAGGVAGTAAPFRGQGGQGSEGREGSSSRDQDTSSGKRERRGDSTEGVDRSRGQGAGLDDTDEVRSVGGDPRRDYRTSMANRFILSDPGWGELDSGDHADPEQGGREDGPGRSRESDDSRRARGSATQQGSSIRPSLQADEGGEPQESKGRLTMEPVSLLVGAAVGLAIFIMGYLFGKGVGRALDKKIDHLLRVKEEDR